MENNKMINKNNIKYVFFLVLIIILLEVCLPIYISNLENKNNSLNETSNNSNKLKEKYYEFNFESNDFIKDGKGQKNFPSDSTLFWGKNDEEEYNVSNVNNYLLFHSYEGWKKFEVKYSNIISSNIDNKIDRNFFKDNSLLVFTIYRFGLVIENYDINQIEEDKEFVYIQGNLKYSGGVFPEAGNITIIPVSKNITKAKINISVEESNSNKERERHFNYLIMIYIISLAILIIIYAFNYKKMSRLIKILYIILFLYLFGCVLVCGLGARGGYEYF